MTEQTKPIPICISWAVGKALEQLGDLREIADLKPTGADWRGVWYEGTVAALDLLRRRLWDVIGDRRFHGSTKRACHLLIGRINRLGIAGERNTILPSVSFEAYHYIDKGDELPREKSERQDITFSVIGDSMIGDSMIVVLPPPAACILYLTRTLPLLELWRDHGRRATARAGEVAELPCDKPARPPLTRSCIHLSSSSIASRLSIGGFLRISKFLIHSGGVRSSYAQARAPRVDQNLRGEPMSDDAVVQIIVRETKVMESACFNVEVRAQSQWVVYGTFEYANDAADFASSWAAFFIRRISGKAAG